MGAVTALSGELVGTFDADTGPSEDLYGYAGKHFDYATALADVPDFDGDRLMPPPIPWRIAPDA